MAFLPPTFIAVVIVLLSAIGIVTVAYCVDFLKPPGRRARVDKAAPSPSPLKGLAHGGHTALRHQTVP